MSMKNVSRYLGFMVAGIMFTSAITTVGAILYYFCRIVTKLLFSTFVPELLSNTLITNFVVLVLVNLVAGSFIGIFYIKTNK